VNNAYHFDIVQQQLYKFEERIKSGCYGVGEKLTRLLCGAQFVKSRPPTNSWNLSVSPMAVPDTAKRLEEAQKAAKTQPAEAEATYKEILSKGPGISDATARDFEAALMGLGGLYRDQKKVNELSELVQATRAELSNLPKAKTAKIGVDH